MKDAKESERRYRNLFDSVPVGIYRSTPDGRFLDGNPALIKILGYPSEEAMLNANINDLYHFQLLDSLNAFWVYHHHTSATLYHLCVTLVQCARCR